MSPLLKQDEDQRSSQESCPNGGELARPPQWRLRGNRKEPERRARLYFSNEARSGAQFTIWDV